MYNKTLSIAVAVLVAIVMLSSLGECRHSDQTCDDLQCCPGTQCTEDITGRRRRPKCSRPQTCDETQCPIGLTCTDTNPMTPKTRAECRVACDTVSCPSFTQCEEKRKGSDSYAVCRIPRRCDADSCADGLECRSARRASLCLADNCTGIDCGTGGECREENTRHRRDHSQSSDRSQSRNRSQSRDHTHNHQVATCAPTCTDSTCPQGLFCEQKSMEVVCRLPQSCEELNCTDGQTCQVTACGRNNIVVDSESSKRTRGRSLFFECVDINGSTTASMASTVASSIMSSEASVAVTATSASSIAMTPSSEASASASSIAMTQSSASASSMAASSMGSSIAMTTASSMGSSIAMTTASSMGSSSASMSASPGASPS